jgi:hypothetical protein
VLSAVAAARAASPYPKLSAMLKSGLQLSAVRLRSEGGISGSGVSVTFAAQSRIAFRVQAKAASTSSSRLS